MDSYSESYSLTKLRTRTRTRPKNDRVVIPDRDRQAMRHLEIDRRSQRQRWSWLQRDETQRQRVVIGDWESSMAIGSRHRRFGVVIGDCEWPSSMASRGWEHKHHHHLFCGSEVRTHTYLHTKHTQTPELLLTRRCSAVLLILLLD